MNKVVCFGSAVVDVIVKSKDFRVLKSHQVSGGVALCEVYGGKTDVDEIIMTVGGAGTNVAVGLSRLGLTVAGVVRVGDDLLGKMVIDHLKTEGIETSLIQTDHDGKTGMSVILVAADGGRSIITARGVSKKIASEEIEWEKLSGAEWIQLGTLGGQMELLENIISWGGSKGIKMGINPGKPELMEKSRLLKLLPKMELVVLNKMEAKQLMEHESEKQAARKLLDMGVKIVVITDGKNGAGVGYADTWVKIDAFKVKSIDDTGAGDAFCSGMVAGLVKGMEMEKALKLGLANGASEVKKLGVKEGLLFEKEIETWLNKPLKEISEKL